MEESCTAWLIGFEELVVDSPRAVEIDQLIAYLGQITERDSATLTDSFGHPFHFIACQIHVLSAIVEQTGDGARVLQILQAIDHILGNRPCASICTRALLSCARTYVRAEFELSSELVEVHELGRFDILHELIQC